jgi:hypothetical protein
MVGILNIQCDFLLKLSNKLRFRKMLGFHGDECEACRLLGYKNPVRTSQEIYYVPAAKPGWLMLCKIRGFHGGHYEGCRLLGCDASWLL